MKITSFPPHAIAVVGLAGRLPGARDLDQFWENIREGVEVVETLSDADLEAAGVDSAQRADPNWVRKATPLEGACDFDAQFFGFSPREAQLIDPQQRVFLECAHEALEHAGWGQRPEGLSVGVYAGAGMNQYLLAQIAANPEVASAAGAYQLMVGNDKDFLCTRVSYKLDLRGPSVTLQTACSTSLVAVVSACRALARGECDMALAGGVSIAFPERCGYRYDVGMILSPDGHCRPFDADAAGIRPGAGAGVVVLKRLADAIADRDTIHAVIRGAAINNDGASKAGYTAPSIEGQVEVVATAQALAEANPRSIGYVEAHGTATPLGDPIEIAALTTVFRAGSEDTGFCQLGSVKANLGHLDAAAGIAGLIKTILVLKNREFPPLVNFQRANPQLELDSSPFAINTQAAAWPSNGAPRRAGVSSFGIGGTNAHVVLEEAPESSQKPREAAPRLMVLSARTPSQLQTSAARLGSHLKAHPGTDLGDAAWTLQVGRRPFQHRMAFVAADAEAAIATLGSPNSARLIAGVHEGGARTVAFMFPGQGSQHTGMGAGLYASQATYRQAVDTCAQLLEPHLGLDIRSVMHAPSAQSTNDTRLAQPALFVCSYALAKLWMSWGVMPAAMIGHSIGEYVAAHLAGVMSLEDALALVAARGRIMQAMAPGGMAAVHASRARIDPLIRGHAEIAAVNGPSLCAIAGPKDGLAQALKRLAEAEIETTELKTSHAFHSAMMDPALPEFREVLDGITLSAPSIRYVSNVTGSWITEADATSPDYWCRHLRATVEFAKGLETLTGDGSAVLLEVGPGVVLAGIARQALPKGRQPATAASLPRAGQSGGDAISVLEAAGRLWVAGVPLDWEAMNDARQSRRIPLPTYPFERQRHIVERKAGAGAPPAAAPLPYAQNVDDFFHRPTWSLDASEPADAPPAPSGHWLILSHPSERALGEAVAREFEGRGVGATLHDWPPSLTSDAVATMLRASDKGIGGAIVIPSRDTARPGGAHLSELIAFSEGLDRDRGNAPIRIVVATANAMSVMGEPVEDHWAAGYLGPVLVLPTEVPGLSMRLVDFDRRAPDDPAQSARMLVREAGAMDAEAIVAYRLGQRFVRRFEKAAIGKAQSNARLKPKGVYLVTGGTGGIALALARWLAEAVSARLLLVARTAPPPRAAWDEWLASHDETDRMSGIIRAVREIEACGGEVELAVADAADREAMSAAIQRARGRWGVINGVVHAAGLPGNGSLSFLKQSSDIAAVLAPKVDGLDALVDLLGKDSLDFVALMSSVNAVVGAPGTVDYAAANAVLDAFVDSARRPSGWTYVVTFNWGAWRDVGMAAALKVSAAQRATWEAHVASSIRTADGVESFARVLDSGRRRVVVTTSQPTSRTTAAAHAGDAPVAEAPDAIGKPAKLDESAFTDLPTESERALAAIWSDLLGVKTVASSDNFFELGGHSLMATRALVRIKERFGVGLVLRDIFDAPTLAGLAAVISQAADPAGSAPPSHEDEREELVF